MTNFQEGNLVLFTKGNNVLSITDISNHKYKLYGRGCFVDLSEIIPIKINDPDGIDRRIYIIRDSEMILPLSPNKKIPSIEYDKSPYYYNSEIFIYGSLKIRDIIMDYKCEYIHELQKVLGDIQKMSILKYYLSAFPMTDWCEEDTIK